MKKLIYVLLLLSLLVALISCGDEGEGGASDGEGGYIPPPMDTEDMFTDRDEREEYTEEGSVTVQLSGESASASSDSVRINGSRVTLTAEATYIVRGSLDSGMLIVDAPDTAKVQIVLDGVNITSDSAPIYILSADKVFISLAAGSKNFLTAPATFTQLDDNNIDAAIFSKQDLTLNGEGSLTVTSPGGHGIVSKDDLVITGGAYSITAAFHGLDANDSVRIKSASLTVIAGKDGVRAENDDDTTLGYVYIASGIFDITAGGDGISSGVNMQIDSGDFSVTSGGGSSGYTSSGESAKGIKAASDLVISDGNFHLNTADDAVHTNTSAHVTGGSFTITTGDDAFHADDTLTLSGGEVNVTKSYEGLEGLHVIVSGGNIKLVCSDDGINAAGGNDSSGTAGSFGNDNFRPGGTRPGGARPGGGFGASSSSNGTIVIFGGVLYINSSGDGIDANGTFEMSGGHLTVVGPTYGDTATLDYDISAKITGGTFIGSGASGMAQTFSDNTQGVIALSVGSRAAGTEVTLTDESGNVIVSFSPELSFAVVIISTPDMVSGKTYNITVGSDSGSFEAN